MLKPGQVFACYEWCLTDKYDKANEEHRRIKKQVRMHIHHKRHSTSAEALARRVAASGWPGEASIQSPRIRSSITCPIDYLIFALRCHEQIEEGDGLPDTAYTWEMDEALRQVCSMA